MHTVVNKSQALNKNQLLKLSILAFFFSVTFCSFGNSLIAKGRTNNPPIINRMLVNVNGPTYSIPVVCATKAVPQIIAAPTKHKVEINCLENIKNWLRR